MTIKKIENTVVPQWYLIMIREMQLQCVLTALKHFLMEEFKTYMKPGVMYWENKWKTKLKN